MQRLPRYLWQLKWLDRMQLSPFIDYTGFVFFGDCMTSETHFFNNADIDTKVKEDSLASTSPPMVYNRHACMSIYSLGIHYEVSCMQVF